MHCFMARRKSVKTETNCIHLAPFKLRSPNEADGKQCRQEPAVFIDSQSVVAESALAFLFADE